MFLEPPPPPNLRLAPEDTFHFACRENLPCFNTCCRNKHLPLTPFDVLMLRRALAMDSDTFLERHALYRTDPASGFPIVLLKMGDNPAGLCPFVSNEGCRVYPYRPTACRLYPLCRTSGYGVDRSKPEVLFYMMDQPQCHGRLQNEVWTVAAWHENQGLAPYSRMNDKMLDLVFHPKRALDLNLDQHQMQKLMVACYNLDIFREFVFTTGFLDVFRISREVRLRIAEDDEALLEIGISFLRHTLF